MRTEVVPSITVIVVTDKEPECDILLVAFIPTRSLDYSTARFSGQMK
jgi:hypothetical protein